MVLNEKTKQEPYSTWRAQLYNVTELKTERHLPLSRFAVKNKRSLVGKALLPTIRWPAGLQQNNAMMPAE